MTTSDWEKTQMVDCRTTVAGVMAATLAEQAATTTRAISRHWVECVAGGATTVASLATTQLRKDLFQRMHPDSRLS